MPAEGDNDPAPHVVPAVVLAVHVVEADGRAGDVGGRAERRADAGLDMPQEGVGQGEAEGSGVDQHVGTSFGVSGLRRTGRGFVCSACR